MLLRPVRRIIERKLCTRNGFSSFHVNTSRLYTVHSYMLVNNNKNGKHCDVSTTTMVTLTGHDIMLYVRYLHWKDVARAPDRVSTWRHRACFRFPGTERRSPSPQAVTVMTDKWRHYDTLSTPDETCLCACEGYKLIGCDVLLFIHPPSPTRSTQICM